MRTRFHRAVPAEIESTARWYERQRAGLGVDFVSELDDLLERLERDAIVSTHVPDDPNLRRVFLERFPFAIVFVETGDEYFILAVAHLKRRPGYFRDREDE